MLLTHDDTTGLLKAWRAGDQSALEQIMPTIYSELHRMAHRLLSDERHATLLQTTALVHEAYLRMADSLPPDWEGRSHLMAVFARTMRNVLIDFARRRAAAKRGGDVHAVTLNDEIDVADNRGGILEIDEALRRLADTDPVRSQAVELHYFGGLTHSECADVLGVSPKTVQRHLAVAEAWLHNQLSGSSPLRI